MSLESIIEKKKETILGKVGGLETLQNSADNIYNNQVQAKLDILLKNETDDVGFETFRKTLYYSREYAKKQQYPFNAISDSVLMKDLKDGIEDDGSGNTGFYDVLNTTDPAIQMILNISGTESFRVNWNDYENPTDKNLIYIEGLYNRNIDLESPNGITVDDYDLYNSVQKLNTDTQTTLDVYFGNLTNGSYEYNETYLNEPLNTTNDYDSSTYSYSIQLEIEPTGNLVGITFTSPTGTSLPNDGTFRLTEVSTIQNPNTTITDGYVVISGGEITNFVINEPSSGWNYTGTPPTIQSQNVTNIQILDSNDGVWDTWTQSSKTLNDHINDYIDSVISYVENYKNRFALPAESIWNKVGTNKTVDSTFVSNPSSYKSDFTNFVTEIDNLITSLNGEKISFTDSTKVNLLKNYSNGTFLSNVLSDINSLFTFIDGIFPSLLFDNDFYNEWLFWVRELIEKEPQQETGSMLMLLKEFEKVEDSKLAMERLKEVMDKLLLKTGGNIYLLNTPVIYPPISNSGYITILFETVEYATKYEIWRKIEGGTYSKITEISPETDGTFDTEYEDYFSFNSGDTYYYKIKAVSENLVYFDNYSQYSSFYDLEINLNTILGTIESDFSNETNGEITIL